MTVAINRYISDVEIEAAAMRLLQRYGQQRHPILVPPVPIEEIIEYTIDIPLIWEAIPDHEGMPVLAKLEARGQPRPEIAIIMNEDKQLFFDQHEGVEQFSQAHELGHYVLHIDHAKLHTLLLPDAAEQSTVLCRADVGKQRDRKEWQAERFAAYLLMPQDLVQSACAGMDLYRWPSLYQLKERFHVTISALTRRLTELRLITITDDRTILPYQEKIATQPHSLWEQFFYDDVVLIYQHNYDGSDENRCYSCGKEETYMGKQSDMRGGRARNADGRLRQVRSDKHLQTVRHQYHQPVATGRGDTHLGTIRKRIGKSLTKLVRS